MKLSIIGFVALVALAVANPITPVPSNPLMRREKQETGIYNVHFHIRFNETPLTDVWCSMSATLHPMTSISKGYAQERPLTSLRMGLNVDCISIATGYHGTDVFLAETRFDREERLKGTIPGACRWVDWGDEVSVEFIDVVVGSSAF
ncbi:hypothetical protein K491DRAFT_685263 [Lophiostoma macrostomum CBS 122681]|uniref:AA1-like domain-containing protein n=1 Tax=Lophiostoma macrostomum CBS 122681 TaxID=1314788 RepID=A0A6A6SNK6_9PLEO|nr:hypothetical protein K491DRAFT_685263 [Lophiostoma macrostomum CBS 122681]